MLKYSIYHNLQSILPSCSYSDPWTGETSTLVERPFFVCAQYIYSRYITASASETLKR